MKAFAPLCCLALLAVLCTGAAAQTTCPIQPEKQDLDFSAVATSCAFRLRLLPRCS
jgi:hypothetical protein